MASEKIDALELDIISKGSTENIDKLIEALGKLSTALGKVQSKKVSVDITKTGDASEKASVSADKLTNSFLHQAVRITAVIALFKKLSGVISDSVANSLTYNKTLNMFSVSMGAYADNATKYGETVRDALGIDIAGWQNAQGIFQTLITGFGVTGDKAAYMSQNLTQLTYDIASFYNLTNDEAANKLKSALSGRLEPIRKLGFDLSQAKLVDIAKNPANYGKQTFSVNEQTGAIEANTKAVDDNTKHKIVNFNQLTQQEKVQLRYIALMTQVTQVQGNYARALNDPANQMKVFKEQVNMTSRAFGNMFIPALNKVLPYLSAFAQLAAQAFQSLAELFGFQLPDMKDRTDISGNVKPYNDVVKATGNAAKNAKKMKDYMLGIDELNVLNPNTGAGTGGGAGAGENSNLKNLKLPGYDFLSKAVKNSIEEAKKNIQKFFDDLKKNPFLLNDIFKWGAGELGSGFWEAVLGKSPDKLAEEARQNGRTVSEQFCVQFASRAGELGSKIWELILGKSPDKFYKDCGSNGTVSGEAFLYAFVEKMNSWGFQSSDSTQLALSDLFGDPKKLGERAALSGRTVGQQFSLEVSLALARGLNSNPITAWLYKMQTGNDLAADIAKLEEKLGVSAKDIGKSFGNGLASGMKASTGKVEGAADKLGKAGVNELKTFNNGKVAFSYPTTGDNAGKGYIGGISKHKGEATKVGGIIGLNSLNQIRKTLGIKSPSREFMKVGEYAVEGYAKGIEQDTNLATNATKNMAASALSAMTKASNLSNRMILNGTLADPMSARANIPSSTTPNYGVGMANEGAMASLASNIYQAVVSGMATANLNGDRETNIIIDGKAVFKAVETEKRKRGAAVSNGAFSR